MNLTAHILHALVGFMVVITSSCQQPVQQVFVLPPSYVGPVVIVFDDHMGTATEFQGKKRVYRIPETGVLVTQFSTVRGIVDNEYIYEAPGQPAKRLEYAEDLPTAVPQDTMVYGGGVSSGGRRLDQKGNIVATSPSMVFFVVGPVAQADSLIRAMDAQLMKLP
jgi:hypothetical protein